MQHRDLMLYIMSVQQKWAVLQKVIFCFHSFVNTVALASQKRTIGTFMMTEVLVSKVVIIKASFLLADDGFQPCLITVDSFVESLVWLTSTDSTRTLILIMHDSNFTFLLFWGVGGLWSWRATVLQSPTLNQLGSSGILENCWQVCLFRVGSKPRQDMDL